jgi:hypothetical protein
MTEDKKEMDRVSILMVNDNPATLLALETILADQGLDLVKAGSGEEGLRLLLEKDFAVILLDVNMPGIDGFEFARMVRQRDRSKYIPIIFVTSAAQTEVAKAIGYSLGAVDYIYSPVVPEFLRAKVGALVELHRKRRELARHAEQMELLNQNLSLSLLEVNRLNQQLDFANKELEAFSYSVSHDLRAPLRAVDGFSRILLEEHLSELSPDAQHYLNLVRSNTIQMGQLIDDLLAFSRTSRQVLAKRSVDPAEIVRQVLEELHSELEGRKAEVIVGDLPECQADPTMLKRVIFNLISNAVKFTRKKEEAQIEIDSINNDGITTYFVKDNGVGFDMRYLGKLFGVFQRLHSESDYEGTGVGLALVQRIVHRHGGRVWAEAEVDKGATFYFTMEGSESL